MKYLIKFENYKQEINFYEDLISSLKEYNIPLEKWGTGKYKTTQHLWNELVEEECVLTFNDGKIYREVEFVGAKILYKYNGKNYRLWEDRAIFKDGRTRIRPINFSMAEKFHNGEKPEQALIRGMKEELGIKLNKNQFTFYNKNRFEENSDYPGIISHHTGYEYLIKLTDEQFNRNGYVEKQKDKEIHFVWREVKQRIKGHYPLPLGSDKVSF